MNLLLLILGILLIIMFIEPIFEEVFNAATIVGTMGGAVAVALGASWQYLDTALRSVLAIAYLVGFFTILAFMAVIYFKGRTTASNQSVIIVLGCKVKGEHPSKALMKRVDAAYAFLVKNEDAVAVLSGGQGRDEAISEAQCMMNLLLEKGIEKERLIIENHSTTTLENIRFSNELVNVREAAIATSEYHQLRAALLCRRFGITAYAQSSRTKLTALPTFLLREVLAVTKTLIK